MTPFYDPFNIDRLLLSLDGSVFLLPEKKYRNQSREIKDELLTAKNNPASKTKEELIGLASRAYRLERKALQRLSVILVGLAIIAILGLAYGIVRLYEYFRGLYRADQLNVVFYYSHKIIITEWGKALAVGIVLSIGLSLFAFKKYQQIYYGAVETAVAVASSYVLIENLDSYFTSRSNTFTFLSGMTTIYIIVRGLTNVYEGIFKPFYGKRIFRALFVMYFGPDAYLNYKKPRT